ncbi:hypothetical protein [Reinekea marinisedimentorum]|uniref:Uncharacterized protein n=1 Tax=Reinekea marinisedimentorum TaxID=230495 RepID=A0A4R3I8J1_9GAMM|nr:hypothetical protein [Reinekea marinisedimentorum]TCS41306.1 hypothetical protein BCF53_10637 [Reinekea marinisedimentorum]
MLTDQDRHNLDRHLTQASQLFKQRCSGWQSGMSTKQAYSIEQRLFPSIQVLSNHAEELFVDSWPGAPWQLKVAIIAAIRCEDVAVFNSALDVLAENISADETQEFSQLLWLAMPCEISKEKLQALTDHPLLNHFSESEFSKLLWPEETIRKLVGHLGISLPYWLEESDQLKYSERSVVLRDLIQQKPHASRQLMDWLEGSQSDADEWQWLTLTEDDVATELYFKHCLQNPAHLTAASYRGTANFLGRLTQCFLISAQAESAAYAVENILGVSVEWKHSMTDAKTGEPISSSPLQPVMPVDINAGNRLQLGGRCSTALTLADWLLDQPSALQTLGWYHLGQALGRAIPDYSHHWVTNQWQFLQTNIDVPEVIHEV